MPERDLIGAHNAELAKTHSRLLRGNSWKKQRIIVIIPSAETMAVKVALAIWNLAFPPNNGVVRLIAVGMEVGDAYSQTLAQVLANPELSQWEYVLTIEHDNIPPPDGVIRLVDRMEAHPEYACIGGLYFTKGEGGVAQIWGDARDPVLNFRPQLPDLHGGLVPTYGTGMGFNLWRLAMFKDPKLPRPWFRTKRGLNGEGVGTQDLVFWTEAQRAGYRCAIDCGVLVGHYDREGAFGPPDFTW